MANNIENLKPLSTEKAREIGSKGGKASVKAKRKKKYIKEQLEQLMLLDLHDCKLKDNMRKLGIPEEELTIQNAMCVSLVQSALNNSIRAFKVIQETLRRIAKRRNCWTFAKYNFCERLTKSEKRRNRNKK